MPEHYMKILRLTFRHLLPGVTMTSQSFFLVVKTGYSLPDAMGKTVGSLKINLYY